MKPPIDLQQPNQEKALQISGSPESLDPVFASAVNFNFDTDVVMLEFLAILPHAGQGRLLKRIALTRRGAIEVATSILKALTSSEEAAPVEIVTEPTA